MSYSNSNLRFNSEKTFTTSNLTPELDSVANDENTFIIAGQGVLVFKPINDIQAGTETELYFWNKEQSEGLKLKLTITETHKSIALIQLPSLTVLASKENVGLLEDALAFYWVSFDAQNLWIRFGVGEARLETNCFSYQLEPENGKSKKFMEKICRFEIDEKIFRSIRFLRDPILDSVPLKVKNTDELTMSDIAWNSCMPKANLSEIGQKLYDNISGKNFVLNTPDFPTFTDAIEYSINTEGCWCNTKLKEKAGEFGEGADTQMVYLRITLGQNGGESPGVPYVMEIWPSGCFSPIHNHAGANAIIRVLYGQINVTLYPYLGSKEPFGNKTFSEGDITWISPTLNQFHRLKNPSKDGLTCITIQCYLYDQDDKTHYDYFDYIDTHNGIGHYEPDSDMDFIEFKTRMMKEWNGR
jgi:hypothetical protein